MISFSYKKPKAHKKTLDDFVKDKELRIVVGGDFNVTFDSGLDCCGGNPTQKESVKVIHDLRLDFDLVDIWRLRIPETKRFTWRQKKFLYSEKIRLLVN